MAPNPIRGSSPMKRTTSEVGFDAPALKKLRRGYQRHHKLAWRQKIDDIPVAIWQNEEVIQSQLARAVSLVLAAVGFEQAEPMALESFRLMAEEYITHFLADVRQSMLSSRRVQPAPLDFLRALNSHNLTLDSLLPHLDPPVVPEQTQPVLLVELPSQDEDPKQEKLISDMLRETSIDTKPYIPPGFPPLPSRHTYKAEPVFNQRELDPKKVRERATEEGRMGEEALRRLVCSRTGGVDTIMEVKPGTTGLSAKQRSRALWKETMQAALNGAELGQATSNLENQDWMHGIIGGTAPDIKSFGSTVNADSIYWRKPAAPNHSQLTSSDS